MTDRDIMVSIYDAEEVARTYRAFQRAVDFNQHDTIIFWGELLLEMQNKTHMRLQRTDFLEKLIAETKDLIAKDAA